MHAAAAKVVSENLKMNIVSGVQEKSKNLLESSSEESV